MPLNQFKEKVSGKLVFEISRSRHYRREVAFSQSRIDMLVIVIVFIQNIRAFTPKEWLSRMPVMLGPEAAASRPNPD